MLQRLFLYKFSAVTALVTFFANLVIRAVTAENLRNSFMQNLAIFFSFIVNKVYSQGSTNCLHFKKKKYKQANPFVTSGT